MSNQDVTYLVVAGAGALSLVVWIALVLVPAWTAYSRIWERVAATVLSLYVLAAFVAVGATIGAAFLWYFDEL
jgi:hypothetical protein